MILEYWQQFLDLYQQTIWNISIGEVITAFLVILFIFLLRKLFARGVLAYLQRFVTTTDTQVDDKLFAVLEAPLKFLFIILAFYIASKILTLPPTVVVFFDRIVGSLIAFTVFWLLYRSVEPFSFLFERLGSTFDPSLPYSLQYLLINIVKILIILLGLTMVLSEWGINVAGFIASLGLFGMAVALAAKDTLANFFGSMTIILDKSFAKGDWIMTPEVEGTVEFIGARSTKIRTFANAVVTIPNAKLADAPLTNWSALSRRRIKMTLCLDYRTSQAQLETILTKIRQYLQQHPEIETVKDVLMVNLADLDQNSINLALYYFTKTTDWQQWMAIREENILQIIKILEAENVLFALPDQRVFVEQLPETFPKMT